MKWVGRRLVDRLDGLEAVLDKCPFLNQFQCKKGWGGGGEEPRVGGGMGWDEAGASVGISFRTGMKKRRLFYIYRAERIRMQVKAKTTKNKGNIVQR